MSVATYAAAQVLRVLPRVRITRAVGRLADARIPQPVSRLVVGLFTKAYQVNLDESVRPSGAYPSFDAFFTRELLPGQRPIEAPPSAVVSPADGRLDACGEIQDGGRFLVKGRNYSAAELLGDVGEAARYVGGQFAIVYLSPRDYHRVHAPVAGQVRTVRSLPGDLYPVNSIGENHVPSLLSINRRVAIPIDTETMGRITVVMVGAMIVGRITVTGIDARDVPLGLHDLHPPLPVQRGDEIGVFHLGSTAVVFAPKGVATFDRQRGPVRLGEALHTL
ncbi:MAG: archaetidylserine decarboxylase [Polyangiaceae bacterium]